MNLPVEPNGLLMEHILAWNMGLNLVSDERQFTHDADLVSPDSGLLYSVKFQKKAAQTGNLSFETVLSSSRTGETMLGNFLTNKTEKYIIVVPEAGTWNYTALTFDTKALHAKVMTGKYRTTQLTNLVKDTNKGRKFDDATNILVPLRVLEPLANRTLFSYRAMKENAAFLEFLEKSGWAKRKK